jgi:NAD(P)-dependent dehydrogenase (short-subunit alcohol dehydrogenase family)
MSVNAKGTFICCREAGRVMLKQRSGSIVNIGSVAGLVGSRRLGAWRLCAARRRRALLHPGA